MEEFSELLPGCEWLYGESCDPKFHMRLSLRPQGLPCTRTPAEESHVGVGGYKVGLVGVYHAGDNQGTATGALGLFGPVDSPGGPLCPALPCKQGS